MYKTGIFISADSNWLAATPDGIVLDPSDTAHPSGLLEIKNPYSIRDKDLTEACKISSFFLEEDKENKTQKLKKNHNYDYQVQCQHTLV